MRVLLVKLSSLGDLVHTFPALTDAVHARPDLEFHWLVEEAFVPIARLHPAIAGTVTVALRRWRRRPLAHLGDLAALRRRLRAGAFERVVDAQGLVKSAVLARFAGAPVTGFDRASAREAVATVAYQTHVAVPRDLHAVDRLRRLFASAFGYAVPTEADDFGLARAARDGDLVFLHGTTWGNKQWPEPFWRALAERASAAGRPVLLAWGDDDERARAERIAARLARVRVAPAMPLDALVGTLASARAVVTVDSGLGHLAGALGVPTLALYGPTDPARTGCRGAHAVNLAAGFACAPCLERRCGYRGERVLRAGVAVEPPCWSALDPDAVWARLEACL